VKRFRRNFPRGFAAGLLVLLALIWVIPLLLTINATLKTEKEYKFTSVLAPPENLTFSNYIGSWIYMDFPSKVLNSLIVSVGALAVSMVMAFLISYAISIGKHRWRTFVLASCVVIFLMPQEAFAYPIFLVAKMVHMYGNIAFLIIPLGIIGAAFGTFLLGNIMGHFPTQVIEAAQIDGASRWQIIRTIVIPMMSPSLFTVALLLFVANWNEYLLTLLLLPDYESMTVPIAVASLNHGQFGGPETTALAAASILGALPSLIVFALFQRNLIRGITLGAEQ
jgi:raffinose/stachyose/melibiose transport system permease protein